MRRFPLLALAALVATLLAIPASASARTNVFVGLGEQREESFATPAFKELKIKKLRYFIRWDAIDEPGAMASAENYVRLARENGARVLVHISTNNYTIKQAKLPSVKQFNAKVGPMVQRLRALGVREFGVWNEANHASQPTWKNPKRAAQFFLQMRNKLCKGCTLVALDLLDQRGVDRYIKRFYKALGRKNRRKATIVGIHNYSDTNRNRSTGTRLILRTVKRYNRRTQFWLTETGGVVKFGSSFKCSPNKPKKAEKRAARALGHMFRLTRRFRRDIKRLYIYNFTGEDCRTRFDAGLVRRDGTKRAGYRVVKKNLKKFRR